MFRSKSFKLAAILCALTLSASVFSACSGGGSSNSVSETTSFSEATDESEYTANETTKSKESSKTSSRHTGMSTVTATKYNPDPITLGTIYSPTFKPLKLPEHDFNADVDSDTGAVTLDASVLFETDSYEISESGKTALKQFLDDYCEQMVTPNKDVLKKIAVEGHTDTQGSYEYNQTLSLNRAKAVLDFSVKQHPELKDYLYAVGKAYESPIYNDDGTVNMEKSRRVVFVPETD